MKDVSVLTPAGLAAVAVIALEAPPDESVGLVDGRGQPVAWPGAGRFRRARLVLEGRVVDDVLVVGRDPGVELHIHGGAGVVSAVLEGLAGKDSVGGLQRASAPPGTPSGLRAARAWASLSHGTLRPLSLALDDFDGTVPAMVEGPVEGPEDGPRLDEAMVGIARLSLAWATLARRFEQPPTVRIIGAANAGKSTLLNALLLEDRALVSPEAGTTRDTVSALTSLEGVLVRVEDTEGGSEVQARRPGADLLIHLQSTPGEPPPASRAPGAALLRVLGKIDAQTMSGAPGVSGRTGQGVSALRARITAALGVCGGAAQDVLAPVGPDLRRRLRRALVQQHDLTSRVD